MVLLSEYEVLPRVRQANERAAREGELRRLLSDARPGGPAWVERLRAYPKKREYRV